MYQKPLHLLLVEDNRADARLVHETIQSHPNSRISMHHVTNLKDALAEADNSTYDVILLDLTLPDATDITGLKQLLQSHPDLPIVVLTGHQDDGMVKKAIAAGAQDFLTKNMLSHELLRRSVHYAATRFQADKLLRRESTKYQALFENALDAMYIVDDSGKYIDANPAACALLEVSKSELLKKSISDFFEVNSEALINEWKTFVAKAIPAQGEFVLKTASGLKKTTEYGAIPNFISGAHLSILRDISERKKYEERLSLAEMRFRKLFDSDIMGIFLTSMNGEVREANQAFLKLTGYDQNDLDGGKVSWAAMTAPGFEELDNKGAEQLLATGHCPAYETEYIRKDGSRIPVLVGGTMLPEAYGGLIAFALDISKNKTLEQQFLQSQKMEAIGRLAGGVAHDFNNILGVILLYVDILKAKAQSPQAEVEAIEKAAQRAARLTRQLLAFSRKQVFAPLLLNPKTILTDMHAMISRLLTENIEFKVEFETDDAHIKIDLSHFEQMILNLVVNAKDAMPNGGLLLIKVKEVEIASTPTTPKETPNERQQKYVDITVTDTGVGISPEIQNRIFEPFFSTKGKGTGLGLATVYGIVAQNNGIISVKSAPGAGSTFEICFPLLKSEQISQITQPETKTSAPYGSHTIMLVEDSDDLRRPIAAQLRSEGFVVLEANNGTAGLDLFESHPGTISLVITDVIMPDGSGPAMVQKIRQTEKAKNTAILFLSGYSANELVNHDVSSEKAYFLEKPFTTSEIKNLLRQILG